MIQEERCNIVSEIPMGETAFDGFSLDNVGDVVIGILSDGEKSFGKDYAVSSGKLTVDDMAYIMSTILTPLDFRDAKVERYATKNT